MGSNPAEDLAYLLHLTVDSSVPVVVTAAQRRRGEPSEDATRNLLDALSVAASPEAQGHGTLLVANELVHGARDVTKQLVSRLDTWRSGDLGALGLVSEGQAVMSRTPRRRHTTCNAWPRWPDWGRRCRTVRPRAMTSARRRR